MSFNFKNDPQFIMILIGGAVAVALLLLAYHVWLRKREKRKSERMGVELTSGLRRPRELAAPEDLARISDLTAKFEEGVKTFRDAGKNLYSLPWYVLVGEPGSGKTEALRHCGVPTPAALGELPGVGGTINMNWWFTNLGVVLDTAGRIMFQSVEAGKTSEWKRFLELLNKSRPSCPINGLLLVIPADSLILDTSDKIQEKAGRIARQLDLIQRTLGIRFPVFVVVTKSDLINGFRSFFDTLSDPQLANQILGWSNPEKDLDAPFDPEQVDKHLDSVRHRLLKRRMGLLLEPINTEDPAARRADQVDDLYSFPDSLVAIAPRLRRYMEMIFVQGEWSPKPLFLRGIYFTSSMRQGPALDKELADALGVPVNSLPEGRVWDQERAFFLRDLFVKKVFPEQGLVTREKKATGLHRRRKAAVLAAGFGAVFVLLGLTWFGAQQLDKRIVSHRDWWARLRARSEAGGASWNLIQPGADKTQYKYAGPTQPFKDIDRFRDDKMTLSDFHDNAMNEVQASIEVPTVFRPVAAFQGNLVGKERRDAYRIVFQKTVLAPVVEAVRDRMSAPAAPAWNDDATAALAQLIRLETASAAVPTGPASSAGSAGSAGSGTAIASKGPAPHLQLDPLFRYALGGEDSSQYKEYKKDDAALQNTLDWIYGPDAPWPPPPLRSSPRSREAIAGAIDRFQEAWAKSMPADLSNRPGALTDLRLGLLALESAEDETANALLKAAPAGPKDLPEYTKLFGAWREGLAKTGSPDKEREIDSLLQKLRARPGGWTGERLLDLYKQELKVDLDRGKRTYAVLLGEIPEFPASPSTTLPTVPMAPLNPAKPIGDEQRAPTEVLIKAREKLVKGQSELPQLETAIAEKVAVDFNRLQDTYLTPAKGADGVDQPRYKAFMQAYRLADARLADPSAGPRPSGPQAADYLPAANEGLADQLSKLRQRLNTIAADARASTSAIDSSVPRDGRHAEQVQDLCHYVVARMAAPCWRYVALAAVIDGDQCPKDKEALAAAVGKWVKGSNLGVDEQPVLPFAGFKKGEVFKPEFNGTEGPTLVTAWADLATRFRAATASATASPPAGQAPVALASAADSAAPAPPTRASDAEDVLDAAGLQSIYNARTAAAFEPYVNDYVAYWTGLLDKARAGAGGVQIADWQSFKAGLPFDAASVNENLVKLVNAVSTALEKVGPVAPAAAAARADKAMKDLRLAATALTPPKTLVVNNRFLESCGVALKAWRGLDPDPAKAAAGAFAVRAAPFYATSLIPPDKAPNVAADYWTAVTHQGFEALCKANQGQQPNLVVWARQKYDRFPLAAPKAGADPELTAADLDRARTDLADVSGRVSGLYDEPTTDDEKRLDHEFWLKFRRLGPVKPTRTDTEWLDRAAQMLAALPSAGNQKFCTVRTLSVEKQKADEDKPGFGSAPLGINLLNLVRAGGKGNFEDTFPPTDAQAVKVASPQITDQPNVVIGLVFKTNPAAAPLPTPPTEKGPWACIRVLYSPRAVPIGAGGKLWHVQVVQPNFPAKGQQMSAWFELEFADPVPIAR